MQSDEPDLQRACCAVSADDKGRGMDIDAAKPDNPQLGPWPANGRVLTGLRKAAVRLDVGGLAPSQEENPRNWRRLKV